jgi:hypothetical protein
MGVAAASPLPSSFERRGLCVGATTAVTRPGNFRHSMSLLQNQEVLQQALVHAFGERNDRLCEIGQILEKNQKPLKKI